MGWEPIGGDPAPGSADAIQSAVDALMKVSGLAGSARDQMNTATGSLGHERWKGSAADEFRSNVAVLPTRLDDVAASYRSASSGLRVYKGVLDSAQWDATRALADAEQAVADKAVAEGRRRSADDLAAALGSQERQASRDLATLKAQALVTVDPAAQASLQQQVATTNSRLGRLRTDRAAAEADRDRHRRSRDDADTRLAAATQLGRDVRDRIQRAVDVAVNLLVQAEKQANLPNRAGRMAEDVRKAIVEYGPIVIEVFKQAQAILSLIGMLPIPIIGPACKIAAVICGGVVLLTSIAVNVLDDFSLDAGEIAEIGANALSLVAAKVGGGKASIGTKSAWNAAAGVAGAVDTGIQDGWKAGLVSGGVVLLSVGVPVGLKYAPNKVPLVKEALTKVARNVSDSKALLPAPVRRIAESVLTQGWIPPGGMLPGNTAARAPSLADHALKAASTTTATDVSAGLTKEAGDKFVESLGDDQQPEIDINLPQR